MTSTSTEPVTRERRSGGTEVPRGLEAAAAFGWRLLVVTAVVAVVGVAMSWLTAVVLPVVIALLLAALLGPPAHWLVLKGVPRGPATAVVVAVGLLLVTGVSALVIGTVAADWPRLQAQVASTVQSGEAWLRLGPLQLEQRQLEQLVDQLFASLGATQGHVVSGVVSTAVTSGEVAGGILLTLFVLIFFLYDGRSIWNFLLRSVVPASGRAKADRAGRSGFAALVGYVRATAAVACMDAVGVGVAAAVIGLPLAPALTALVFLGAFVPYIGILVTGTLTVVVCLATVGFWPAVAMAIVIVVVTQLEGHVLHPLLLGRGARLHPLAVVLSISAGFVLAGVAGAVVAVPLIAVIAAGVRSLRAKDHAEGGEGEASGAEKSLLGRKIPSRRRRDEESHPTTGNPGSGTAGEPGGAGSAEHAQAGSSTEAGGAGRAEGP